MPWRRRPRLAERSDRGVPAAPAAAIAIAPFEDNRLITLLIIQKIGMAYGPA
jgi:hypothetical protein